MADGNKNTRIVFKNQIIIIVTLDISDIWYISHVSSSLKFIRSVK